MREYIKWRHLYCGLSASEHCVARIAAAPCSEYPLSRDCWPGHCWIRVTFLISALNGQSPRSNAFLPSCAAVGVIRDSGQRLHAPRKFSRMYVCVCSLVRAGPIDPWLHFMCAHSRRYIASGSNVITPDVCKCPADPTMIFASVKCSLWKGLNGKLRH